MPSLRTLRSSATRTFGLGAVSLLWLGCNGEDVSAPTTGEIRVTISTAGSGPNPGGYTLSLDGQPGTPISISATLTLSVEQGAHVLELGGLTPNCVVTDGARRDVEVTAGEATDVSFDVHCGPTTGGLRVVSVTTGGLLDPDGYILTIDGGGHQTIGANDTVLLTELPAGDHTVLLSGIVENCSVAVENPRVVAVPSSDIAEVTFEVVCTAGVRQWTPIVSGTSADLVDVWGSSATDLFVVGEELTEDPFELASVIRHYNGTEWVQQLRQVDLELQGVWGSSPTDVFAVGFDFFSPIARVLHFDGVQWSEFPNFLPGPLEESIGLQSVWGSSASDVFAVGSGFDGFFNLSLIFHYDGSMWRRQPVTGPAQPALVDVWGSSAADVYAVGQDNVQEPSTGVILRYNGVNWASVFEEEGLAPTALWGSAANDIFVTGFRLEGSEDDFRVVGTILHYDGIRWSHMPLPATGVLNEVSGSSGTDVFAVGEEGVILHFDGTAWTASNPTTKALLGVWATSPSEGFAVGVEGTVLHGAP